ncbi:efflux RND transporter periplasmic adaptor subunit [Salegentibacter chungangensis]|uniref:Efflux RND transporter periplasmic adaptor subunit n=1 Tax=Salegentibacter chungangensis TaxID=1335724 RepID=A0ABW3NNH4_9FLAO
MKKAILLLSIPLFMTSCGKEAEKSVEDIIEGGDLQEMRSKKSDLSKQKGELTVKLDMLTEAIENLDTSKSLNLVRIQEIEDTIFKHYAEVQGDVATDENIIIYPEFSGLLNQVRVNEGDRVSKGQTLAVIDDGGLSSQLAQLEAQATLARTTFERQKRLWEQNIGSEIQYLEAKTNYEALQSSVEQMKSRLAKTIVTAPFSGVIDDVLSDQGEVVNPGQNPLFRLINLDNMYVEAHVPETYLNKIRTGTDVKVELSATGKEFDGKVRQVGNNINPNNRTFKVQVSIPNKNGMVKPNQIATIKLNDYTSEEAVIVPESTIQKNALGESLVFILEPKTDSTGIAKKVIVETGYVYKDNIEITGGLEAGQKLIVEGGKSLRDGQEVKIRN